MDQQDSVNYGHQIRMSNHNNQEILVLLLESEIFLKGEQIEEKVGLANIKQFVIDSNQTVYLKVLIKGNIFTYVRRNFPKKNILVSYIDQIRQIIVYNDDCVLFLDEEIILNMSQDVKYNLLSFCDVFFDIFLLTLPILIISIILLILSIIFLQINEESNCDDNNDPQNVCFNHEFGSNTLCRDDCSPEGPYYCCETFPTVSNTPYIIMLSVSSFALLIIIIYYYIIITRWSYVLNNNLKDLIQTKSINQSILIRMASYYTNKISSRMCGCCCFINNTARRQFRNRLLTIADAIS
jgi:hypothetical protein